MRNREREREEDVEIQDALKAIGRTLHQRYFASGPLVNNL